MGSTKYTYIGVFMKIPTKTVNYEEKVYSLENEKSFEIITKTKILYPFLTMFGEEFEDIFHIVKDFQTHFIAILENIDSVYVLTDICEDDYEDITIRSLDINGVLNNFKKEFASIINKIEEEFGVIEINFGIINYCK